MTERPLVILTVAAENVKRIRAVRIAAEEGLNVVAGKNAQGKTSVLDAIMYALGGKPESETLRRGAESAQVLIDLGEMTVTRKWDAEGESSLTVRMADGSTVKRPQDVLDRLAGKIAYDPLAFVRLPPKKQRETLMAMLGLDFTLRLAQREKVYSARTNVNRDAKNLEARIEGMGRIAEDVPEEPLSAEEVTREIAAAGGTNEAHRAKRERLRRMEADRESSSGRVAAADQRLRDAQRDLENAHKAHSALLDELLPLRTECESLQDVPTDTAKLRLASIETTNATVRANKLIRSELGALERLQGESAAMSAEIAAIDKSMVDEIAAARMPVPGLGFNENGLTLNGIGLENASAAECLRVSVGIGLAMNPRLRVILVRDGSLLDDDSMRLLSTLAEENRAQLWIERVETNDRWPTVVIHDGEVSGAVRTVPFPVVPEPTAPTPPAPLPWDERKPEPPATWSAQSRPQDDRNHWPK